MRIGFVVGDLSVPSGGTNVIVEYAAGLAAAGHEVLLLAQPGADAVRPSWNWHPRLRELRVLPLDAPPAGRFDFAFATQWTTFFDLGRIESRVYGYLNQSYESRFHTERKLKLLCRSTYALPLLFVTEARWLAELIGMVQSEARTLYVRNGLDAGTFPRLDAVPSREGPLRVLVEGPWSVPFKGVPETFELLDRAAAAGVQFETSWLTSDAGGRRPTVRGAPVTIHERVPIDQVHTILRDNDVLLKLSRVEGMFGPPLEMFSQGGTAITTTVTGADEYMVHGENGLVVEPYNMAQVPRHLERLAREPALLASLRAGALRTARAWPTWPESVRALDEKLAALEGWSNAPLRPALTAMATLRSHWLDEVCAEIHPGPGEQEILRRLRGAKDLLPEGVRGLLRSLLTKGAG